MAVSKAERKRWAEAWKDPAFEARVNAELADPLGHSQLAYWLRLEAWEREEGLLVLAGVEPGTVSEEFEAGAGFRWSNAMPFSKHKAFFLVPDPANLDRAHFKSDDAFDAYIQTQEERARVLEHHESVYRALEHKLDHSPSVQLVEVGAFQYRPISFLAWAKSIGFKPDWFDWAASRNLLPADLNPMERPFFDADSADYPKLLAIAIRAWEHARAQATGTPKQRIARYLQERYPDLTPSTRDAIALIANWQKGGGRPSKKQ